MPELVNPNDACRPIAELRDSGLLWLINRSVFHPRGLALALHVQDGQVTGWELQPAEDGEPFSFDEATDIQGFRRATATLRQAQAEPRPFPQPSK